MYTAVFVFFCAFVTTSSLTDAFHCAINTTFICAFKDIEENRPPKFLSPSLREGLGIDRPDEYPDATKPLGEKPEPGSSWKKRSKAPEAAPAAGAGSGGAEGERL